MKDDDDEYDAHVLILGGSFLGVELVRSLRKTRRGRKLEIIVVDRQTEHPYIPLGHELLVDRLAYGVAERTVLPSSRYLESRPPARWVQGEIVGFDPDRHVVELADGRELSGRFVVVALGSEVRAPAGLPGGERLLAYKSEAQYELCRRALVELLGEGPADPEADPPQVLVAGGGITGVEICGELAHLAAERPAGWRAPKLTLVHGGGRLLPALTAKAGERAAAALRDQGVDLRLGTRLVSVSEDEAILRGPEGEEERLPCQLGFWAGGLQPPPALESLNLPLTEDGWLRVGPTLQCFPEHTDEPEIFAGGDVARVYGGDGRWPTMQRAIEAIFAAHTIATNIFELERCAPDYPDGVPPLWPHRLWEDFPHGVSVGGRSLVVYGRLVVGVASINIWFRRFLMRQYMRRYS